MSVLFCSGHPLVYSSVYLLLELLFQFMFLLAIKWQTIKNIPALICFSVLSSFWLLYSILFFCSLSPVIFSDENRVFRNEISSQFSNCACVEMASVSALKKKEIHDATKFIDHSKLQRWKFNYFELLFSFELVLLIN